MICFLSNIDISTYITIYTINYNGVILLFYILGKFFDYLRINIDNSQILSMTAILFDFNSSGGYFLLSFTPKVFYT